MNETIIWITDKTQLPHSNKYVLIAFGYRTGVGYCKKKMWYHEDGGVESLLTRGRISRVVHTLISTTDLIIPLTRAVVD